MCGIAGTWGVDAPDIVEGMLDQLAHRGPDDEGMHRLASPPAILGHRRLSIVDVAGGHQPFVAGDHVLVANGEIYNAAALGAELGESRFVTRSDNEVILHLLADGGPAAAQRLEGMFAFAYTDGRELILGRDPVGIKPLYVGDLDGHVIFSSELRAFPGGVTDIAPITPGTTWSSRDGVHRFGDIGDPGVIEADIDEHARRVRTALEEAVHRRLMSDVAVGSFLSGGLDSSAIVALLRPHVEELHTFSVGLEDSPDLAAAQRVADHLGTIHHTEVLDPDELSSELGAIVAALESFDQDLVRSAVPTYFTARLAARHLKVVLTGEGADELFSGYTYHKDIAGDEALHADTVRSLRELHHVNLQRVDRLTMAHSIEARVPFLDLEMIETALAIPPALRQPGHEAGEKAVLRRAVADLLPAEITWRDKAQFDEGSGTADLLPHLTDGDAPDLATYRTRHPGTPLRSAEECRYHQLLAESLPDPGPVLATVARWADRG